jgi:hypothetical protein
LEARLKADERESLRDELWRALNNFDADGAVRAIEKIIDWKLAQQQSGEAA